MLTLNIFLTSSDISIDLPEENGYRFSQKKAPPKELLQF
jgi:hypothetical protein